MVLIGEGFRVLERIRDHQMGVEEDVVAADALDDGHAERDVGYEVAVHDVEVEHVGSGGDDFGDLAVEFAEVGGEEGRCDGNFVAADFTDVTHFIYLIEKRVVYYQIQSYLI